MSSEEHCSWCGAGFHPDHDNLGAISQGICIKCAQMLVSPDGATCAFLIENLSLPALVVDSDVIIRCVNRRAAAMLGRDAKELVGVRGGEAFGCVNARQLSGCGRTSQCRYCTIRNTVTMCHVTGNSYTTVPAALQQQEHELNFLVSAEKIRTFVLVRIVDIT